MTETISQQPMVQINLPAIPNKRYFTIGEVSELCQVKAHVLRYWEQEFSQLQPSKRRGNRRYYRLKDVKMVLYIKALLYQHGFTISGARQQLQQQRGAVVAPMQESSAMSSVTAIVNASNDSQHAVVTSVKSSNAIVGLVDELEQALKLIRTQ